MNILVFDTETTSLEKPFCYNVGFVIYNTDEHKVVASADYVIEQVWHNLPLFSSAYYAEKRPLYVNRMRARSCVMDKWGYVMQRMLRLIREYEVTDAYAYNSKFDEKVFAFNCDWYKVSNPLDSLAVHDIRGYVHKFFAFKPRYQQFCEQHELYTESGNYSTTAEAVFRFCLNDNEFTEEHTALADSEIECTILALCIAEGGEWNMDYKVYNSVPRVVNKVLTVTDTEGKNYCFPYQKIRVNKDKTEIVLK
jgi:hypothetical protein